jgi:hypothetical protein
LAGNIDDDQDRFGQHLLSCEICVGDIFYRIWNNKAALTRS